MILFIREPEPGEGSLLGEIFVADDDRLQEEEKARKAAEKAAAAAAKPVSNGKKSKNGKASEKASKKGKDKKGKGEPKEVECVTKSIIHKETQTPIKIPEVIVLSELASFGESAYRYKYLK